jgi:hypothetical protein
MEDAEVVEEVKSQSRKQNLNKVLWQERDSGYLPQVAWAENEGRCEEGSERPPLPPELISIHSSSQQI